MKEDIPVVKGETYSMPIVSLGHSGEGVAKYREFTVFVPLALIGEEVEVRITEVKKKYARGKIERILRVSPNRAVPRCAIYEQCGGCQLQHLAYEAQLAVKRQQVVDAVERIGKLEQVVIHRAIGAENPWNYRNKMQFPIGRVGNDVVVGCYAQGTHAIVDTKDCLIQHEANNQIASAVRGVVKRLSISVYDEQTGRGVLRHVIGRVGGDGQVMVVLVTATDVLPKQEKVVAELRHNIPGLVSVMQNINREHTNVIFGRRMLKLWGELMIADSFGGLTFHISARSFFQVNTAQAEILYRKAAEYAGLAGAETVLDAYCGTGTIALFLAKQAKKVYGIEIVESAVLDARKNAENNGITNAEFIAGDATNVLPELYQQGVRPDVIVLDPPRAGCERKVLEAFAAMNPARIVYVSCNPASMARDSAILSELGYAVKEIQPVDMFCQTSHIESVVLIERQTL